ncbi:hypothetical protein [Labilibaculum sp.]|uniref:hypothetical protein n=1 Tax=Labilibaculum sp. TaxID=2060723 RepID=UPI0035627513
MKQLLIPLFILIYCVSYSQTLQTNKIISPERQFDFLLGDWEVYTNDEQVAHNTIRLFQNGHLLQENWVLEQENFTGTSYSFYNNKIKQWQQIWVDSNGNNLLLRGNFKNKTMILDSGTDSYMGEDKSIHKISWTILPDGEIEQIWESTIDKGKTWTIQFEGIYKKKK